MTLPVIRRLRESIPDINIGYCIKESFAPLIRAQPQVDLIHVFRDNWTFLAMLKELRNSGYDLFVDLQANFRSFLIRHALPAPALRYKKRRLAREMVVRRAHLKMAVDHTVKAYLAPLARLGIDFTPAPPMMALPSAAISFANGFFKGRELVAATSIIALCPGASHHEKKWPFRYFADVARKLLEDAARGVVVVSATEDHIPERLEIEHQRLAAARDFDILRVAAILSKCRVALTNDSGLMHLANAVGVPVLAIFGPTNPRLGFAPTLPGSRVICDDVVCSPCSVHGQRPCYQPEKYCFKDITPERVFDELKEMSNRTNSAAS